MRLIDADELVNNLVCLKQDLEDCGYKRKRIEGVDDCIGEIKYTEAVDAVPVVHAHWFTLDPNPHTGKAYKFACSNCEEVVLTRRQMPIDELRYVFCPHCGAKMDEEET